MGENYFKIVPLVVMLYKVVIHLLCFLLPLYLLPCLLPELNRKCSNKSMSIQGKPTGHCFSDIPQEQDYRGKCEIIFPQKSFFQVVIGKGSFIVWKSIFYQAFFRHLITGISRIGFIELKCISMVYL